MQRKIFEQTPNSIRSSRILTGLFILIATMIAGYIASDYKKGLLLIAALSFIILLFYFDVYVFVYLLALTWWLPFDVGRLLPFLSNLGPWAQNITASEILAYAGLVVILLLSRRTAGRIFGDPVWILLLMLIVGGILAAGKIQTDVGIVMFRQSTFFFAAVILLCRGLLTDQKIINRVLVLLIISGLLFCSYILFASFMGRSLLVGVGHYEGSSRIGGIYHLPFLGDFYFGPNNIGLITSILAVLALSGALLDSSQRNRTLMSIVFIFNSLVLVATGSRASMASALIATVFLVIYLLLRRNRGRVVVYGLIFVVAFAILIPKIADPEIMQRLQYVVPTDDPYGSVSTRLALLQKGIRLLFKNPLGIGYGTFVTLNDNYILWEQNLFLNTALGAGFMGLISLIGFYVILFMRAGRKLLSGMESTYLYWLAGCVTLFVNSLFTDPNSETAVYFAWLIMGITLASVSIQSQQLVPHVKEVSNTASGNDSYTH